MMCSLLMFSCVNTTVAAVSLLSPMKDVTGNIDLDLTEDGTTGPDTLTSIRESIKGFGTVDEDASDKYGAGAAVDAMEKDCGWDPDNSVLKKSNCMQAQHHLQPKLHGALTEAYKEMDVVVPTIRDLDFLQEWKPFLEKAHFILIQDGDAEKHLNIPAWVDFELYNRNDIAQSLGNRSWVISSRDSAIRNFGFLVSKKKYIYNMDDDTFPAKGPDGRLVNSFMEHYRNLRRNSTPSFFNTLYDPYREHSDFVRGYPYSRRIGVRTVVSHGIWLNVPDYDAVTQLVKPRERNTRYIDATITIPHKTLYPMCSMNMAFDREEIGAAMMHGLMGDGQPWGRFDDMFAGWTAKVCADKLKLGVKSGHPYISHKKASNPFTNLKKEYKGLEWQEKLIDFFENVDVEGHTAVTCYQSLADKFHNHFARTNPYFDRLGRAMQTWASLWKEAQSGHLKFAPSRSSKHADISIGT